MPRNSPPEQPIDSAPPPREPGPVAVVTLPDGRHLRLPLHATDDAAGNTERRTLANFVWMSGEVEPPALCSGLGRCGRCAARFTHGAPPPHPADADAFSGQDLADGWRLLCRHEVPAAAPFPRFGTDGARPGDACTEAEVMAFTLPAGAAPRRTRVITLPDAHAPGDALLLAVDLGTTTLHWSALARNGQRVAHGAELNPQMGAGSEVMSRLAVASSAAGLAALRRLTLAAIGRIAAQLPAPVGSLCVAGNTAMTTILLGRDVSGLAAAPYRLDYAGGTSESLPEPPALAAIPDVWIPPQPAPFVGGDVTAGMAAILYGGQMLPAVPVHAAPGRPGQSGRSGTFGTSGHPQPHAGPPTFPFLLADLGTNGEFVLATGPDTAIVTSVALGPALEGIGLSCGGVAQPGAVAAFTLLPTGLAATVLPDENNAVPAPTHICGTGYLSLVRILLRAGLLDEDGRFVVEPHSPLSRRLAATLVQVRGERRLPLTGGLHLSAGDVEEILKVKAAFSLAYQRLLGEAGIAGSALDAVYLAGALGEHARPEDLETLGFLPAGVSGRARAVGNASLRGAELLLLHPELRERIALWRTGCRVIDLTTAPGFAEAFVRHMHFG